MGAAAQFNVTVRGKGGHAAMPHTTVDPVVAGAAIVTALQVCLASWLHPSDAAIHSCLVQHCRFSCDASAVFRSLSLPVGGFAHCKL
jgi:metal-dependent amidase/aminoacylase/carboxypeptidase family protein